MNRERKISIKGIDPLLLLGPGDENLRLIEAAFPVKIVARGDCIRFSGEEAELDRMERFWMEALFLLNKNGRLDADDVRSAIRRVCDEGPETPAAPAGPVAESFVFYGKKGVIRPKTPGQERYCRAALASEIVFAVGPAGTGKTYLAVAMAVEKLRAREVSRIILTRPAIEAGENLGYLPGDLMEKVDPYLRPLTDALFDMLPNDQLQKHLERKVIEIVPLAYMRGRTLNDAFVILDEAQNTTSMQMKMFLTRLGIGSRSIITGDDTQTDLPDSALSGLIQIQVILRGIEGIDFVFLDKGDVVRHRLVKDILQAYESAGERIPRSLSGLNRGIGSTDNGDMPREMHSQLNHPFLADRSASAVSRSGPGSDTSGTWKADGGGLHSIRSAPPGNAGPGNPVSAISKTPGPAVSPSGTSAGEDIDASGLQEKPAAKVRKKAAGRRSGGKRPA
jgi:phosphate starvation-inducible PhoH-like protein